MRIFVEPEQCQGHNRCVVLAPSLVELDDFGNAHAIGDGEVVADSLDAARQAVANCPEHAISLVGEGGP